MSKNFKSNTLDNFFTTPDTTRHVIKPEPVKNWVVVPPKEETKSKRVNLLIKSSTHTKALAKCKQIGVSLNECINQLLDNWINS